MSLIKDTKYELEQIDFSEKSLKKFGITIGSILLIIGLYFTWKITPNIFLTIISIIGILLFVLGITNPKKLSKVYKYWMIFALILGWFVSRIILTILFYIIIAPIGIVTKILGKDFLRISNKSKLDSFWLKKDNSIKNIEKMY
ncbi:MAG: hypothetical protein IPM32_03370 [Ignavibacteriae bacterium]|nr:hypothetical protein [Ignavibacteriota bacterium]